MLQLSAHHQEDNHCTPIQDPQKPCTDTAHKTEWRIEYDNLAAHTVSWTPDDEGVTLETCRVLPSNKQHKKLQLIGTYMIIIKHSLFQTTVSYKTYDKL